MMMTFQRINFHQPFDQLTKFSQGNIEYDLQKTEYVSPK
jgi:hypothetical protein